MAKGKGKRASGANEALPESGVSVSEPQNTPGLPQIDESAFAGLRQKIEQRLKDQSSGKGKSKKTGKPDASAEKTPTKKEKDVAPKAGKFPESAHGKKRDRNGDVIAREEKKGGKDKRGQPEKIQPEKKGNNDDALRQEILALGGTEEDLDLLAGIDSESEVEGAPSKPKGQGGDEDLRKELSKMLEAAGHVVPDDIADEEAGEDEEEGTEDDIENEYNGTDEVIDNSESEQDVSDISDMDEVPAPKANSKTKASEVVVPKEYAKLVSCTCAPSCCSMC